MITYFHLAVFLLSVIMSVSFLIKNIKIDCKMVFLCIFVMINCGGRYMLAASETLETAVWADTFLYIGECFAPLSVVLVVMGLCNIKISRVWVWFMTICSSGVMCLTLTIGKSRIFYKETALGHGNGYHYLMKSYGELYLLYPALLMLYGAAMLIFSVYALIKRKQISGRAAITVSMSCLAIICPYLLEKFSEFEVSFLSAGYLTGLTFLIRFSGRSNRYDLTANIADSVERIGEDGYLIFDNKYLYIRGNDFVKKLFPEIKEWVVDQKVVPSDSYLYQEAVSYLLQYTEEVKDEKIIQLNDKYYQLNVRNLSYRKKRNAGYLMEFIDRTWERKYYAAIESHKEELVKEVKEKTEHISQVKDRVILGMADMVESRDNNTGGHIKRTSEAVRLFAEKLAECRNEFNLTEHDLSRIVKAAPMHDLGKIAVPDAILHKPGKYTEEEFTQMKKHPVEGAVIVERILHGVEDADFVKTAKNIAYYHHEKWNGKGYPIGISGTDIPVEARIMALADVFDALVSKRGYKDAYTYDIAFSIIEESLGEHFDPALGKVFLACRPELEALYKA